MIKKLKAYDEYPTAPLTTVLDSEWDVLSALHDEILKSLASGTKTVTPLLVREHSNTTAQPASYHRASFIHSNQLNINHSLAKIAYE